MTVPKFSTHVALMNPEYQPANFAPGDEVPAWALDQVGEHVLAPEEPTESDDSGTSDESGADGQDGADGAGEEGPGDDEDADGEDSTPPAADDQPDFTAPAPARRGTRTRTQK